MRVLFDESRAASECRAYALEKGFTEVQTKDLLDRAYHLGKLGKGGYQVWDDDRWVSRALKDDSHKKVTLLNLFNWRLTDEGSGFWSDVYLSFQRA